MGRGTVDFANDLAIPQVEPSLEGIRGGLTWDHGEALRIVGDGDQVFVFVDFPGAYSSPRGGKETEGQSNATHSQDSGFRSGSSGILESWECVRV